MTRDFTIPPFFPLTEYVWLQDFFYATRLLLCYCLVSGDDFWTYCENIRYIYSLPLLKLHYSQVFSTFSYYHQNTNFNRKCTGKKNFCHRLGRTRYYLNNSRFPDSFRKKFFLPALFVLLSRSNPNNASGWTLPVQLFFFFVTLQVFSFLLWSIWLISLIPYPIFYFYLNFFWTVLI